MTPNITFREFRKSDGPAFTRLAEVSGDAGRIGYKRRFQGNAYSVLGQLHGKTHGIASEASDFDGLVGSGFLRLGSCQYEGEVLRSGCMHNLVVHPGYRRRGIASNIIRRRIDLAENRLGQDCVLWAAVQDGNLWNRCMLKRGFQHALHGRVATFSVRMRPKPPNSKAGYRVRVAAQREYLQIVEEMNRFYRDYNFFEPCDADELARWCESSPFPDPFRHYVIVEGSEGELLAGAGVSESYKLRSVQIEKIPLYLRAMNRVVKFVPDNGIVNDAQVTKFWYRNGNIGAARYLWESCRWMWRDRCTSLTISLDPNSGLIKVIRPRMLLPRIFSAIVVKCSKPISHDRLIYLGV